MKKKPRPSAFSIDPADVATRSEAVYVRLKNANVEFADKEAKRLKMSRARYMDALLDKARKAASP